MEGVDYTGWPRTREDGTHYYWISVWAKGEYGWYSHGSISLEGIRLGFTDNQPIGNLNIIVPSRSGVTCEAAAASRPPSLFSTQVNGAALTLTFDRAVDPASVPSRRAFQVTVDGSNAQLDIVDAPVSISGTTVTLNLVQAVAHGQAVTVRYTEPATGNKLQGAGSVKQPVTPFAIQTATNNTPPRFSMAAVNGTALTLTFDGGLDAGSVPAADAFQVTAGYGGTQTLALGFDRTDPAHHVPMGTAEPGPGPGEITLTRWVPATTGLQDIGGWQIYAEERSTGNVTTPVDIAARPDHREHAPLRSYTLRDLKPGVTYTVGVAAAANVSGIGLVYGDIAQARLEPPAAVDLAETNPVAISGSSATLTLAEAVRAHQTVKASYTAPVNNPLRDSDNARNPVPDFAAQSVTNNTTDTTPPGIESVQIRGNTDHHFQRTRTRCRRSTPSASAGGYPLQPPSRSRAVVTLTYAVGANLLPATARRCYRKPTAAKPLRDLSANEVENFIDRLVTNNTPPAFASASVDGAALTITFNGALDPDSVPAGRRLYGDRGRGRGGPGGQRYGCAAGDGIRPHGARRRARAAGHRPVRSRTG